MRVALGADHAGFELKQTLRAFVEQLGHEASDLGTDSVDSVDYPDFAKAVAKLVADDGADVGLLICGTGLGMAIAANKVRGFAPLPAASRTRLPWRDRTTTPTS